MFILGTIEGTQTPYASPLLQNPRDLSLDYQKQSVWIALHISPQAVANDLCTVSSAGRCNCNSLCMSLPICHWKDLPAWPRLLLFLHCQGQPAKAIGNLREQQPAKMFNHLAKKNIILIRTTRRVQLNWDVVRHNSKDLVIRKFHVRIS